MGDILEEEKLEYRSTLTFGHFGGRIKAIYPDFMPKI